MFHYDYVLSFFVFFHSRKQCYNLIDIAVHVYTQLNTAQSKVPAFLGVISVVACFTAAIISLALSFSIVPRQVMPWTGFLLVYEWTFTIFFLLFGFYLHAIHLWGKHLSNHAASLSSHPESLAYDSGKGMQWWSDVIIVNLPGSPNGRSYDSLFAV